MKQTPLKIYLAAFRTFIRNIRNRKFEPEVKFLKDILLPGDHCFHIGASDARHSYVMSGLVGDTGKVFAFEPSAASFRHLELMVGMHGLKNVDCFHMAMSDNEGMIKLITPKKLSGHAGRSFAFISDGSQAAMTRNDMESSGTMEESVEATTLDVFTSKHGIKRVDFIRCDTEGSEMKILRGAQATIDMYKPSFLIEIHNYALKDVFNSSAEEATDFFSDRGYLMFKEDSGQVVAVNSVDDVRWKDYFFIHPDRLSSLPTDTFKAS